MAKTGTLYVITNKLNGHQYIGVTARSVNRRWLKHLSAIRCGKRSKFYNAVRKYGESFFIFKSLAVLVDFKEALETEVRAIAVFKPYYNTTLGGQGALGYKHTEAELKRMAERVKGTVGYWKGKKRSAETLEKISKVRKEKPVKYWLGKKRDVTTIEKIISSKTGKSVKITPKSLASRMENQKLMAKSLEKRVMCLNDELEYNSLTLAAKAYGLKVSSVSAVCRGQRNSIFGLRFTYKDSS